MPFIWISAMLYPLKPDDDAWIIRFSLSRMVFSVGRAYFGVNRNASARSGCASYFSVKSASDVGFT